MPSETELLRKKHLALKGLMETMEGCGTTSESDAQLAGAHQAFANFREMLAKTEAVAKTELSKLQPGEHGVLHRHFDQSTKGMSVWGLQVQLCEWREFREFKEKFAKELEDGIAKESRKKNKKRKRVEGGEGEGQPIRCFVSVQRS